VDIGSVSSTEKLFEPSGCFDSLISTTGAAKMGNLSELKEEDLMVDLQGKRGVMPPVN